MHMCMRMHMCMQHVHVHVVMLDVTRVCARRCAPPRRWRTAHEARGLFAAFAELKTVAKLCTPNPNPDPDPNSTPNSDPSPDPNQVAKLCKRLELLFSSVCPVLPGLAFDRLDVRSANPKPNSKPNLSLTLILALA